MAKRKRSSPTPNWSDLPQDLVASIAKAIVPIVDYIAFGAVRKSWRSVATKENFAAGSTHHQFPLLMLPIPDTGSVVLAWEDTDIRGFHNLTKRKSYKVTLPEAKAKLCYSSLGWLITISTDWKAHLVHPLNRAQIELPNVEKFRYYRGQFLARQFLWKFVLSSSPSWASDYVVMVLYKSEKMAFWRPGDTDWTMVDTVKAMDLNYYKGQFYIMALDGSVLVCDIEDPHKVHIKVVVEEMPREIMCANCRKLYLVESGGVLLAVPRFREEITDMTTGFRVFQVPFRSGNWLDSEVKNLGNRALFLGDNSSFSIEASKYSGCKANCIYFTSDLLLFVHRQQEDMGIYDMEDGKIERFLDTSPCFRTPYLWVQPSF